MIKEVDINKVYAALQTFQTTVPTPVVELVQTHTKEPWKVLVATILTARTKDETTIPVVKRLFAKVKKIDDFTGLDLKQIEELIYPVGFYKTKAKHLKLLPIVLNDEFGGRIPEDVEDLTRLPGVGRKTANLVVALGFDKPAICVDIHVHRIMNRLGYVKTKDPYQTEMTLRKKLPVKYWTTINGYMVSFGQNLCRPVSPYCSRCPIRQQCNRIGVTSSR